MMVLSKQRLLVQVKAACQWLLVQVMAAVNDCLSTAVNDHLPKPKHYYQWQHLQYREALVRGNETVEA
jgi:hypothetical protein